tara:strand:- start:603 stop:704 length:102 start_codon:yes stop_codon:yes gene_type:complete
MNALVGEAAAAEMETHAELNYLVGLPIFSPLVI